MIYYIVVARAVVTVASTGKPAVTAKNEMMPANATQCKNAYT
jgi:hypothetical protein